MSEINLEVVNKVKLALAHLPKEMSSAWEKNGLPNGGSIQAMVVEFEENREKIENFSVPTGWLLSMILGVLFLEVVVGWHLGLGKTTTLLFVVTFYLSPFAAVLYKDCLQRSNIKLAKDTHQIYLLLKNFHDSVVEMTGLIDEVNLSERDMERRLVFLAMSVLDAEDKYRVLFVPKDITLPQPEVVVDISNHLIQARKNLNRSLDKHQVFGNHFKFTASSIFRKAQDLRN